MKLVALQQISDQLPPGATFEIPDEDVQSAETLILGGYARKADPVPESKQPTRRAYHRRDLQAEE